jgi:biopolymer transport protein ExbD
MKVETETKPYDTINVTPMLDLAYVLLVIFIIMTTASVQGLKINLPKPSNKPATTAPKEVRIVQIQPDGSLLLNGSPITLPELESRLSAAVAKDPDAPVMIKGDPQTHYASVVDIVDMAGRLHISNVGLVTARIGT